MRPSRGASPEEALATGQWVKLIAGASNEDLFGIEALAGIYSLAGVHCLDVAADPAVVKAARRGMAWARLQARCLEGWAPEDAPAPWLMVSLSDGEDPHFRKAWFDPRRCPASCSRPCERVCPAQAIPPAAGEISGVIAERCYGCGRCLPICPLGLIEEQHHVLDSVSVAAVLAEVRPDAVEIHTQIGRSVDFEHRVNTLRASGLRLARVAVSCGLEQGGPVASPVPAEVTDPAKVQRLASELWQRFDVLRQAGYRPLWQLDGRPMSGDVGAGTAHAAVRLLERIAPIAPPGPLQLAGGTNANTLPQVRRLLRSQALRLPPGRLAGVAFGGVARRQLQPLIQQAEQRGQRLLEDPQLWPLALEQAQQLISPWLRRRAPLGSSTEGSAAG
jgi:Fe-S-cluster-containing hydrogenase component 2